MREPTVTIIMPALNEERSVGAALCDTLGAFDDFGIRGEVLVIDDGSSDGTGALVQAAMSEDSRIRMIRHETRQGLGSSDPHRRRER